MDNPDTEQYRTHHAAPAPKSFYASKHQPRIPKKGTLHNQASTTQKLLPILTIEQRVSLQVFCNSNSKFRSVRISPLYRKSCSPVPSLPLPPPPHFTTTVHWGALPAVAFPKKAADTLLVPPHWRFGCCCCCCCKGSGHCRGGSWGGGSGGGSGGGRAPDLSLPWQPKTDPRNKEKKSSTSDESP